MDDKQFLTPTEVAKLLLVSPITVRQWAQKGMLQAQMTPGGHRRFELDVVKQFAKQKGLQATFPATDKPRFLIVDDDKQVNSFLVELLKTKDENLEIETAFDGFEAGMKIQKIKPDIILMDLMMPGMDGFEVCRMIKNNPDTAHIRLIAMTGYHSADNIQKIMATGAEKCIAKPIDVIQLFSVIGFDSMSQYANAS